MSQSWISRKFRISRKISGYSNLNIPISLRIFKCPGASPNVTVEYPENCEYPENIWDIKFESLNILKDIEHWSWIYWKSWISRKVQCTVQCTEPEYQYSCEYSENFKLGLKWSVLFCLFSKYGQGYIYNSSFPWNPNILGDKIRFPYQHRHGIPSHATRVLSWCPADSKEASQSNDDF